MELNQNSPRALFSRLNGFIRFQGIAKAIQMVAIAKLKQLTSNLANQQIALSIFKELFLSSIEWWESSTINNTKYIVVPFFSDKQCCGIINKKILTFFFEWKTLLQENQRSNIKIFVMGFKGRNALSFSGLRNEIIMCCTNMNKSVLCLYNIYIILLKILSYNFDILLILFNKYISYFVQEPVYYKLPSLNIFNFFFNNVSSKNHIKPILKIFLDRNKKSDFFLNSLYYYCVSMVLLNVFEENSYSELGSRVLTMENIVKNTKLYIDDFRLRYNKARQSLITTELIEIISASEFLKK